MKTSALFTKQEIEKKISEMAKEIRDFYGSEDILAIGILTGAFMFYKDLLKELNGNVICDFCSVSYYAGSIHASQEPVITLDVIQNVKDKNILLVDCIADRGLTFEFIKNHLQKRQPKSIKTAALAIKPEASKKVNIDFKGFEVDQNVFVMGYGVDYQNQGRNLDHFVQVTNLN